MKTSRLSLALGLLLVGCTSNSNTTAVQPAPDAHAETGRGGDSGAPLTRDSGPKDASHLHDGADGSDSSSAGPCGGHPFFCDDFVNSALATDYTTYQGTWTRAAGSYSVTYDVAWQRARSTLAYQESDFDVTIHGNSVGDYGFGIVYGASASLEDGYAVIVHPAQFQSVYLKQLLPDGSDVNLSSAPLSAGLAGTPLILRVRRQGTEVTVWLNGAQMLQASDGANGLQGRIGLLLSDTNLTSASDAGIPPGAAFTLFRIDSASLGDAGVGSSSGSGSGSSSGSGSGSGSGSSESGGPLLGFYVGGQTQAAVDSEASGLGVTAQAITCYTDGSNGWSGIGSYVPPTTSLQLLLGVNLCPDGDTTTSTPSNLNVYQQLATTLVSHGFAHAIIRLGWEWNGNWFAWSNASYSDYVTAFQDVHQTMMAVSGAAFEWDWCANAGSNPTSGTYDDWYPGDAYVDYIGVDHYDNGSSSGTTPTAATSNWNSNLNATGGLGYSVTFALAHGKKVSVPEWGLDAWDDPTFINLMSAFVHDPSNNVGYQAYFDCGGSTCQGSTLKDFTNSAAAFKADF